MLVLNTNDSQPYKYSSGTYPDFNQLILTPGGLAYENSTTIDNAGTAYTVNGTKVNEVTSIIVAPVCFSSTTNIGASKVEMVNSSGSASSGTIRLGLPQPLSAGLVIGKRVYFFLYSYYIHYSISGSSKTWSMSRSVTPKILHTDGTLTQITQFTGSKSGNVSGSTEVAVNKVYSVQTNGIISQEGDTIVADIYVSGSGNYSGNNGRQLTFGYFLGNGVSTVKGIQVSVE